jgi:hypothetical protein
MAEHKQKPIQIKDYQQFVGAEVVERIQKKARSSRTFYLPVTWSNILTFLILLKRFSD